MVRSKEGIALYQSKYALDILKDSRLLAAKPCNTPMDNFFRLQHDSCSALPNVAIYRKLTGRLLSLTHTRPVTCFAVSQLCFKYVKKSPTEGLFFSANSNTKLKWFSNSDLGTCLDTRKYITCYCLFFVPSLVS